MRWYIFYNLYKQKYQVTRLIIIDTLFKKIFLRHEWNLLFFHIQY